MLAVISSQEIPTWNWDSLCTDDEANEELKRLQRPSLLAWFRGGYWRFQNILRLHEVMRNLAARECCGERREMACTHRQWIPRGKLSRLDCILGPKANLCHAFAWNQEKVSSTWDHYPVYVIMQKERKMVHSAEEKSELGGDHKMTNKRRRSSRRRFLQNLVEETVKIQKKH